MQLEIKSTNPILAANHDHRVWPPIQVSFWEARYHQASRYIPSATRVPLCSFIFPSGGLTSAAGRDCPPPSLRVCQWVTPTPWWPQPPGPAGRFKSCHDSRLSSVADTESPQDAAIDSQTAAAIRAWSSVVKFEQIPLFHQAPGQALIIWIFHISGFPKLFFKILRQVNSGQNGLVASNIFGEV